MSDVTTSNRERHRLLELPNGGRSEVWLERRGDRVEIRLANSHSHGSGSGGASWARCSQHGCLGEALPQTDLCLPHSPASRRKDYLDQAGDSARTLALRGTSISQQLWDEIVASAAFEDGRPIVPVSLVGSEISARIQISDRVFDHYVDLSGASVYEAMEYSRCRFNHGLNARHVRFDAGPPAFHQCTFARDIDVSYSQVHRVSLAFQECTFERSLSADGFSGGGLYLTDSTIRGGASFKNSNAHLILNRARIDGTIDLSDSECIGFTGEELDVRTADRLGPFAVKSLHLARATFGSRILIEVQADSVDLSSASFIQGGLIVGDRATMRLDQLRLGGPLRVSGTAGSRHKPQVVGLRNADVGAMSLANVDLSRCSFQGAHGLDTVVIESTVAFSSAPWWAGRRRYIADEYAWRSNAGCVHRIGWKLDGVHVGPALPQRARGSSQPVLLRPLEAEQVAAVYRELRRSLEARSDMPSAAEFYYGEMEMRRWSAHRPLLERVLVWCYWLLSGYGVRAGRAFVAWLVLVSIGAWSMLHFSGTQAKSAQGAFLVAVRAAIPGFPLQSPSTAEGQWIETILRIFGTVCIALFVMAARSMVMRRPSE